MGKEAGRCTSDGMMSIVAIVLNLDYKRLSVMCKKSIIPKMCNAGSRRLTGTFRCVAKEVK